MIAKLAGLLDSIADDHVVVDVGGVGYLVFCSGRTMRALPAAGQPVVVHIETHVREDHIHLYGFADQAERDWFRLLQSVQGVGARVALAILTVHAPGDLMNIIAAQDKAAVSQANGVGAKLAGRIVAELKDAVSGLVLHQAGATGGAALVEAGVEGDAVSALVNLGYRRTEAAMAVAGAARAMDGEAELDVLIRAGLRELGR